ncbi:hypothetical protein NM208_g1522 [Fusarium decemcellulare]|uniref:Uncharacterized protein n=2 Tax=Fusarium decemcellulare TaxID=57161 RepID=A0ACC1SF73_9HYPO|nr:hypothetical protein NM208_g5900 [Fusarium decemcellulare]KAJ3547430.1 hypothetical protein NM208_g1522 [Fusarium decemcellulare]
METIYDSRAWQLPAATTGGSASIFDGQQAVFLDEISCADAVAFAKAAEYAGALAPRTPTSWRFKCTGKCKSPPDSCLRRLLEYTSQLKTAAEGRTTAKASISTTPDALFPGIQQSGGCSRSPAWDAIESPSLWFTSINSPVPAPDLCKLLSLPPSDSFVFVDTWEKTTATRLQGTRSHASTAPVWHLSQVEMQCVDKETTIEPITVQTSSNNGTVGTFRYQGQIPLLGNAQDALAYQLFAIGSLRNARVLSVVMCCVELYHTAAKLLEMRDETMANGLDTRVGGLRTSTKDAKFYKITIKGDVLPPKLSGYATCPTSAFEDMCNRESVSGAMRNTSVLAMSLAYDRGVYGGSISGLWALMDAGFMYDYSTGSFSPELGKRISDTFATVRGHDTGDVYLNAHLLDIVTVVACNFTAIKAKAALEDDRKLLSMPCIAVWDDLAAAARYRMADAAFAHVWYDSPGDEVSLVLGGLGCALHDLIDIGPDVACGEVSNLIPSLTGGDLSFEALWSVYVGLLATLEWCAENDPFNTTGLAILLTHWWQLGNLRHRPVALMSRMEPSPAYAVCPEKLTSTPTFNTITRHNGLKFSTGQDVLDSQRLELDRIEVSLKGSGLTELQGLITRLVRPVLDYTDGRVTGLPTEITYCTDVLESCISHRHSEKVRALWGLMLVMWKCGSVWMAVMANTQYTHHGSTNCDRGRVDYNESTWGQAKEDKM